MREDVRRTLDDLERQRQAEPEPSGQDLDQRMLAVGPDSGQFLNTLIHASGAKRVIEVGGSMGYSTIWMAEAVEANGGLLTSLEVVPAKAEAIRRRAKQAGLERTVEVQEGDALQSLRELRAPFDLVLIDAWKDDYPAYFDLVFPKLRPGGLMLADNISRPEPVGAGILAYVGKARSQAGAQSQLVPIGSGLELTLKLT